MLFFMRWRPPARPWRGPAGSPSTCLAEGRRRRGARRGALLSEIALARRIRVRPRLGRGLRARRRRVLPQAPGLGAVHAGDRPPAAGAALARRRQDARWPDRRPDRALPPARGLVGAFHLPAASRNAQALVEPRLPAPHRPAVPLGERTATRRSTRSWRRCRRASARPSGASGATRSRPASPCTG